MSMSQEEIESLMSGLDLEDEASSSESVVEEETNTGTMSEDDINDLIAETEEIVSSADNESSTEESVDELLNGLEQLGNEDIPSDEANIDDIIKELDNDVSDSIPDTVSNDNIDEELDNDSSDSIPDTVSNDNIDELLASVEGVQDEQAEEVENSINSVDIDIDSLADTVVATSERDDGTQDIDKKIDSGVFPLPVEEDTKVVNQLSAVANDSEEKATKIFDVLSNILDYNTNIQNDVQQLAEFNQKQIAMLSSLSAKFPNIEAFKINLEQAESMGTHIQDVNDKVDCGNSEIFQAMELMQYHDINRQKIERVMSVIRKLSTYLNNLFEDDGNRQEVAVAKHIHGDTGTADLVGDDDLESLIAEFNKE